MVVEALAGKVAVSQPKGIDGRARMPATTKPTVCAQRRDGPGDCRQRPIADRGLARADQRGATDAARACGAQALLGGGQARIEQQHARGSSPRASASICCSIPDSFVELDAFVTTSLDGVRASSSVPRRWRRHRPRDDRRPAGVRLQPGLHGLRRVALGGVRREDLQGDGPGDEGRRAGHRPERFRWRANPGRRRRRSAATPTSSCATPWPRASSRRSR